MQSPLDETQLWCPGPSLWSLITEHVTGSELPEIHAALGSSLVDVYAEVHAEAAAWHGVWRESRGGSGGGSGSRGGTPLPRQHAPSPLADPPAVKELVRAEVKMLLQTLGERSGRQGRVVEELWNRYKPETVDYALGRPHSSCRGTGDSDDGSRPGSRCSARSSADDEIEAMRDQLNVSDIDQVAERLRSVLREECETLNRMVKHFKGNIKQRLPSPCGVDESEPSLAELRELRGAIQVDLALYPSSPSASQSVFLRELKNGFRLPAAPRVSDETLRALSAPSAFRPRPPPPHPPPPHPLPPVSRPTPRPPPGAPPRDSGSPSRAPGERRCTSASAGPRKIRAPACDGTAASAHANRHFAASLRGPGRVGVETVRAGRGSPELNCPDPPVKTRGGNSRAHETRPSSLRGDSSLTEGERSPTCGSRNISPVASVPPNRRQCGGSSASGGACTRPTDGQFFTSPRKAPESVTRRAKGVQEAELEFISECYWPAPPARVTT
ncbi:coiled-coil domain-containing protein 24 [Pungitius pungitius]|uniref:coiled-coil domain-containing protein 24 n=1 Tax=Pungitius pungitius TaxID=134920 RepID=UPI002E0F56F5